MTDAAPSVLVVDDSPLVTDALCVLLDAAGYRADAAGSIAEACAKVRAGSYDAVLLDLTLPDGDGLTVLADCETARVPVPPVLALTGHDDPGTAARCRAAGCQAVLVKPVSAAVLLGTLRDLGVAADSGEVGRRRMARTTGFSPGNRIATRYH